MLGVEPKADSDTIQRAYAKLAQKYFPNNPETGNSEMFDAINMAYETLSDPQLRATFDKLKGVGQAEGKPTFSGAAFFDALGRESILRSAILCVLYDRRRTKPSSPSLSMRQLESIVEATETELATSMWYLKQRGLVASDDKSSLHVTVDGLDFLENKKPEYEDVMPFIKAGAVEDPSPRQAPRSETESVLNTLNRALARV